MKRSIGASLVTALTAMMLVAGMAAANANTISTSDASGFVSRINAARSSHGERRLSSRSDLAQVAVRHSIAMAKAGYIYHNDHLPYEVSGNWRLLGENVGEGYDVPSLHEAFMESAPHRHNILTASFNQIGVGVVIAQDGTMYVTEVFATRLSTTRVVHHTTTTTHRTSHPTYRAAAPAPAAVAPAAPAQPSAPSDDPAQETFASLVRMAGLN